MVLRELSDAVARLGFQTQLEEEWEDAFYSAVNHALREIRRVLPEYAAVRLSHYPISSVTVVTDQTIGKDGYSVTLNDVGMIEISLSGTADLEVSSAQGRLLSERIGCKMPAISAHRYLVSDLILNGGSDDLTITLMRRGACRISSLRYWEAGEVGSTDLPEQDGSYTVYDLTKLYADFGALQKVRREGRAQVDYRFEGKCKLALPTDDSGEYTVVYRKKVPTIDKEQDREIPLSEDECDLLILLTASYILLDENDGKSAWYKQQYDNRLTMLLRQRRPQREQALKDYYGW